MVPDLSVTFWLLPPMGIPELRLSPVRSLPISIPPTNAAWLLGLDQPGVESEAPVHLDPKIMIILGAYSPRLTHKFD